MCYICVTFSYIGVIFMKKIFKVLAFMFLAVVLFSCNHSAKKGKSDVTIQAEQNSYFASLNEPQKAIYNRLTAEQKNEIKNHAITLFKDLDGNFNESDWKYNCYLSSIDMKMYDNQGKAYVIYKCYCNIIDAKNDTSKLLSFFYTFNNVKPYIDEHSHTHESLQIFIDIFRQQIFDNCKVRDLKTRLSAEFSNSYTDEMKVCIYFDTKDYIVNYTK